MVDKSEDQKDEKVPTKKKTQAKPKADHPWRRGYQSDWLRETRGDIFRDR